jgi:uncharacterized phage protein (TIGR02218 family)
MKNYDSTFLATLNSEVNCLVTCWQWELGNGDIFGFTDGDRPIIIDGVTYQPDGGFKPSDIDRGLGTEPNSMAMQSYFSQTLPESILTSGQVREARVFAFRVDPYNLPETLEDDPLTFDPLIRGRIDKLSLTDQTYQATLSGLKDGLSKKTGYVVQNTCRNEFCDSVCGLDIEDYTDTLEIVSIDSQTLFNIDLSFSEHFYTGGRIIWQTGDNLGLITACLYSKDSKIKILDKMPYPLQVGDTATIAQACNKTLPDCDRRGNRSHFNGEPKIPGDAVIASAVPQTNPG